MCLPITTPSTAVLTLLTIIRLSRIFYDGELIAWSCAMNHIGDVGAALAPGSYPGLTPSSFCDGFVYSLLKAGENFTTFKWFDLMWERRTRQPLFNMDQMGGFSLGRALTNKNVTTISPCQAG